MSNTSLSGAIVLRWYNRNILDIDGTNIYRSTSPMDPNNLPEPYAVVEGGKSAYVDHGTELYQEYYYRIGVVHNGEVLGTDHELHFKIGSDLEAPFNLDASYHDDDSGDLQEPFSLIATYDKFKG